MILLQTAKRHPSYLEDYEVSELYKQSLKLYYLP